MSAVERLEDVLRTWPGVKLAVLFGSAARGADRPRDLDVGVWLEPGDVPDEVALRVALSRAARQDVDLIMLNTAPAPALRDRARRQSPVRRATVRVGRLPCTGDGRLGVGRRVGLAR